MNRDKAEAHGMHAGGHYSSKAKQPRKNKRPDLRHLKPTSIKGVYLAGDNNNRHEMPYAEYLMTGHWRRARAHAIQLAGSICTICSGKWRLNVHHLHYNSLWNEQANDVVVLCETCHHLLHVETK